MINRDQLLKNEVYWTEIIQNNIFSDVLEYLGKEKISQKELARRLGVSKGRVSQILKGDNMNFRIDTLVRICLAIGKVPSFSFSDLDNYIEDDSSQDNFASNIDQEYSKLAEAIEDISCDKY